MTASTAPTRADPHDAPHDAHQDASVRFVLPADSFYLKNMAALWAIDPKLAVAIEAIEEQPSYPVEPSRSGAPTARIPTEGGRHVYLHSRYDRKVVELVRSFDDPYPYFRGMIAEIGLPTVKLLYDQPQRRFGVTKNNWYTLYDLGMLGIINYSKIPLRLATFAGFAGAMLSFLIALGYLVAKLIYWRTFTVGVAPMIIGVFFIQSLLLVFLGVMGEYIGAIYTQLQHRPFAVELERVNFDQPAGYPKQETVAAA